jgi:hypothetical protein
VAPMVAPQGAQPGIGCTRGPRLACETARYWAHSGAHSGLIVVHRTMSSTIGCAMNLTGAHSVTMSFCDEHFIHYEAHSSTRRVRQRAATEEGVFPLLLWWRSAGARSAGEENVVCRFLFTPSTCNLSTNDSSCQRTSRARHRACPSSAAPRRTSPIPSNDRPPNSSFSVASFPTVA